MKINLITIDDHKAILDIYEQNPVLTLQNKGYQYINKNNITDELKAKIKEVETILKIAIVGFRSFKNFKLDKDNNVVLRFQYNYDYEKIVNAGFVGVGYILLDELLNGFNS